MGLMQRVKAVERPLGAIIAVRAAVVLLLAALHAAGVVGQDVSLPLWPGIGIMGAWTLALGICALARPDIGLVSLLKATALVDAVAFALLVDPLLDYGDPVYALLIAETVSFVILLKRRVAWLLGGMMALAYLTGHVLSLEVLQPVQYLALVLKVGVLTGVSIAASYVVAHLDETRAEALAQRAIVEELNEQLKTLSQTDELTGLDNYRSLQTRLDEEIARARRHGKPVSVLMIDLDDFKRVNDTHGHPVGDVVLAESAAIFKGSVREMDLVARYGGEEFTVVLPETDGYGARVVAEKLAEAIAGHRFPDEKGKRDIRLTISVGYATFPDYAFDKESLLSVADDAVYNAKNAGKNRVAGPQPLSIQSELDLELAATP